MSRLQVTGLRKSFGATEVLRGMDLDVPSGALVAVLGPSGCGKTTLLRVVAGFEHADAGEVRIGGEVVAGSPGTGNPSSGSLGSGSPTHLPPERRRIGVVPQEGALFPHLSVADNVAFGLTGGFGAAGGLRLARGFGLSRKGRGSRQRRERVGELLALVGLADLGDRMPAELSGGQQQRVAVARALAPDPHVVLLDEPFSALDAGLRAAVRADVRAALTATGATGVLVTHDQEEALSTADLVAVVRDGVVVQSAAPEQLYAAPRDVDVATFVGEAAVLSAVLGHREPGSKGLGRRVAHTALGELAVLGDLTMPGDPTMPGDLTMLGRTGAAGAARGRVVVRPEQVRMVRPGDGVPARVVGTVFYGHDASVQLEVTDVAGRPVSVLCRTQGPVPQRDGTVDVVVVGPVSFFAG